MSIEKKIKADFIAAYKAKDMVKKNFLGLLKGEIETKAGKGVEITDKVVLAILGAMKKSLAQTIVVGEKSNVDCSAAKQELEYLKPYLPSQMSDEDVGLRVKEFLQDIVALNPNMNEQAIIGKTIGAFNGKYKGQAEISIIKAEINKLLV